MSGFKAGQRVICIESFGRGGCVRGIVYTISWAGEPCECGQLITVGIQDETKRFPIDICPHCAVLYAPCNGEWEFCASLFRPLDPLREQLDRIESEGAPAEIPADYAYQLMGGKKEWV